MVLLFPEVVRAREVTDLGSGNPEFQLCCPGCVVRPAVGEAANSIGISMGCGWFRDEVDQRKVEKAGLKPLQSSRTLK